VILQINHSKKSPAAASASEVIQTLCTLLEQGHLEPRQFARLRVHLDWIQYKHNFREPVTIAKEVGAESAANGTAIGDIHINTRQLSPEVLREQILRAVACAAPYSAPSHLLSSASGTTRCGNRLPLEEFRSFRQSIAWDFNRLYWHKLTDWEQATGRSYEQALPGGKSDANHPDAVAHGVADFWTLLKDLDSHRQLPPEIFALEIGVGLGTRAKLWLDAFRSLDRERASNFYPRLKFLLADYSLATLERSRPVVRDHLDVCSFLVLDALNPMKTLSFLRHKILHIHLTNVYDNLPDEELARRDGRLYLVEVRAYIPAEEAARLSVEFSIPVEELPKAVDRLLEVGPDFVHDHPRGVAFWQQIWSALRLQERLVPVDTRPADALPEGWNIARFEEVLQDAPSDFRFHLSTGAMESFRNTLPLLRPRGYLQIQDIFVTDLNDYRMGFYGPGKLDGSIVNWVNGVFLREVAERAGYDVHFAPFHYRPNSRTSVLYTTQRE
jgi:hypothetical protein